MADAERLSTLVDGLLARDADAHAEAVAALAEEGDERVVPHLFEVFVIDSIAGDWESFGFPEVLRGRDQPRYLELPEARWPGARDALAALADPDYDSPHAWVEWESWYSQRDLQPLAGFERWKLRLYRSYLPPVGSLLAAEPRSFDVQDVRWGNCDRSFLAALNAPDFVPGEAGRDANDPSRYLSADDVVFGFVIDETAYAVPRWMLFPHELLNATLEGRPVSLTYCTLCNAPILYDRRVDGETLTFGSSGLLLSGNKVMYDEGTETLWDQHAGRPIAGAYLETRPELVLEVLPVTQTTWGEWIREHPDTLALDRDTGYDYDYDHYDGNIGFFRHYWADESVVQPGVERAEGELPEKADVYGIVSEDDDETWVIPIDAVPADGVLVGTADGREIVAVRDGTGDVAVYPAPPTPVERQGSTIIDAEKTTWEIERDGLRAEGGERRDRIPGRHGLWFAFRTHYERAHVLAGYEDGSVSA